MRGFGYSGVSFSPVQATLQQEVVLLLLICDLASSWAMGFMGVVFLGGLV